MQLPLEHSRTTQAVFWKFVDMPHEVEEELKHVRYYKDLNNVRFNNIKEPLNVYSFKEQVEDEQI